MFSLVDVVIIMIVSGFVFFGFFFGLVHTLGSLIGTIIGMAITSRLIGPAFDSVGFLFGGSGAGKVFLFIILFLLISRLIGIAFWLIGKVLGLLAWIPFASTINRLLGAIFGLIEGILVVAVVTYFALQYLPPDTLTSAIEHSFMAKYLLALVAALQILFPTATKAATEMTQPAT